MNEYDIKISIVIVNYNVKYFLEQCLLSVRAAVGGMDAEVFVIDNNSEDGSVDYLKPLFPEVIFLENKDNPGFAVANNQAIKQCKGEYVLLLNPDTIIGEESLRTLSFFMDEHPKAGGIGVKMLDGHGVFLPESKRSFPSPWVSFCKLFGLSKLFPQSKLFARYSLPYLNPNKQHRVDVLAGAFMLIRHEALDKAGLLDESFFMYGEDIDLSYRLVLSGYANYYIPERILHYKGESTKHDDISYVKRFYGAMLIFYKKYYARSGWLMSFFIRLAIGLKASLAAFSRKSGAKSKKKALKHRRILIICHEENFEQAKQACVDKMPELEYVNMWDLDEERVMDAICRRNQMKGFTDIAFCLPDVRFEQILLFIDTMVNKKTTYHIYNKASNRLVSPDK
ncbi:GT2 family glycosyltransferase [Parabacteroides sp. PF5-5]|uniref:glycosyltransferase family 2 protein n=1 Tax=unclassified Parabacteroides TaxID=2649774 RepID=UPI0024765A63|nr:MULTISPECIES: glycosyltransferase family 2 protein [unclassified Parabacteroides]MDH6306352.1 GT2 family glycosyltransferase [Parabacteroides sp. PH5-39]MDH6314624.1 GT2 family glycosyltransferase [Parabacteroides sp. PF5-13]MDH6321063.1 GT2 family glycosyltransferase [Parabacteroides sp. PH5-13]MDH6324795.1 GT2 family glycosyltransferase [Parabacteroides sp. PH5-8]MDH6325524.1 GT2 family glycosyltransferase [Parabacteroides sp. PH5-41]